MCPFQASVTRQVLRGRCDVAGATWHVLMGSVGKGRTESIRKEGQGVNWGKLEIGKEDVEKN